jgi:hypothetical protein
MIKKRLLTDQDTLDAEAIKIDKETGMLHVDPAIINLDLLPHAVRMLI